MGGEGGGEGGHSQTLTPRHRQTPTASLSAPPCNTMRVGSTRLDRPVRTQRWGTRWMLHPPHPIHRPAVCLLPRPPTTLLLPHGCRQKGDQPTREERVLFASSSGCSQRAPQCARPFPLALPSPTLLATSHPLLAGTSTSPPMAGPLPRPSVRCPRVEQQRRRSPSVRPVILPLCQLYHPRSASMSPSSGHCPHPLTCPPSSVALRSVRESEGGRGRERRVCLRRGGQHPPGTGPAERPAGHAGGGGRGARWVEDQQR